MTRILFRGIRQRSRLSEKEGSWSELLAAKAKQALQEHLSEEEHTIYAS